MIITPIAVFCSLEFISTIVSFGALAGFILLNIAVIWKFMIKDTENRRDGKYVLKYLVCPLIGLLVTLWIFSNLGRTAHTIGFLWLASGAIYLLIVTKGYLNPVPQMDIS